MKKYDFILGIDPDSDKSGVTLLNTSTRAVEASTMSFPNLIEYIILKERESEESGHSFVVVIEAGWLIQTNWHTSRHDNHRVASSIGNRVGRNQETGRKLVEMCKHMDVEVKEIRPLKKFWIAKDGKISQGEIVQFIHDFPSRSNQEMRDSALIAWYFAGLPVKLNTVKK